MMTPGEYLLDVDAGPVEANAGRRTARVVVKNAGDRPIQAGSHFHFFETNASLLFDRAAAYGMRLNIASGTAVRFEPGEEKEVELTEFGGLRIIYGFNGLVAVDPYSKPGRTPWRRPPLQSVVFPSGVR